MRVGKGSNCVRARRGAGLTSFDVQEPAVQLLYNGIVEGAIAKTEVWMIYTVVSRDSVPVTFSWRCCQMVLREQVGVDFGPDLSF